MARFLSADAGGFLAEPVDKFFTKGFRAKTQGAVASYNWTASLFTDSNVALDAGTGDVWDQTAPNKRSVFYKPCGNQPVFWVDFSGTAQLKFAYTFHNYDADDDFNQVDLGVRVGTTNVIVAPSTGATIVSNNITDGDYAIQYQFRHDAKTDAYYSNTVVMNVASNVITIYRKWIQHATTYQAYESVADTKVTDNKVIQVTWDPSANTWSIQTDAQNFFNALVDADKAISSSGGTLTDNIADVAITTDASDHRVWEVTIA